MSLKSLFVILTILAVLSFSALSLTMGKHHKFQSHKVKALAHTMTENVMSYFHLKAEEKAEAKAEAKAETEGTEEGTEEGTSTGTQMSEQLTWQLFGAILSDEEIMDSMMNGKPLTQKGSNNLKKILLENKNFMDFLVKSLDEDEDMPKCYKDLKQSQKRKILEIMINQMNFSQVFNSDSEDIKKSTEAELAADAKKIETAITNDKELGADVSKCIGDNLLDKKVI